MVYPRGTIPVNTEAKTMVIPTATSLGIKKED